MITIKVEVTRIDEIRPHPNAGSLERAIIGGWQMCVYQAGSEVVYFEPGTVLPSYSMPRASANFFATSKTTPSRPA